MFDLGYGSVLQAAGIKLAWELPWKKDDPLYERVSGGAIAGSLVAGQLAAKPLALASDEVARSMFDAIHHASYPTSGAPVIDGSAAVEQLRDTYPDSLKHLTHYDSSRVRLEGGGIPSPSVWGYKTPAGQYVDMIYPGAGNPIERMLPEVLAHEAGHAFNGTRGARALLRNVARHSRTASTPALIAGLGMTIAGDSDTADWAPAVAAAPMLPTVAEEAYANVRGYQLYKTLGKKNPRVPTSLGRYLKMNGPGFGTYLAAAALAPASVYVTRKYLESAADKGW